MSHLLEALCPLPLSLNKMGGQDKRRPLRDPSCGTFVNDLEPSQEDALHSVVSVKSCFMALDNEGSSCRFSAGVQDHRISPDCAVFRPTSEDVRCCRSARCLFV